ncbi:MAG: GNAT family N-acetyltransferase [Pseudomonadota bacterium]
MIALTGIPTLETERLVLRPPASRDVDACITFYASERARFVGGPSAEHDAWVIMSRILGHWAMRGFGLWALTLKGDDRIRGVFGHWKPGTRPENEIGWSLWDPTLEGKGYAHDAALACRTHAYDVLGWKTAVSYIAYENDRSVALAKRLGAWEDPDAPRIEGKEHYVFRHPGPEALA